MSNLTKTPADVAKLFRDSWEKAGQNGAHVSPELRRALEDAGVPPNQVVDRVNGMVDKASGIPPAKGAPVLVRKP